MKYSPEDEAYIVWAVRHGGSDREIAHDLGRSRWSVEQKIRQLREIYEMPDRRKVNSGMKKPRKC